MQLDFGEKEGLPIGRAENLNLNKTFIGPLLCI